MKLLFRLCSGLRCRYFLNFPSSDNCWTLSVNKQSATVARKMTQLRKWWEILERWFYTKAVGAYMCWPLSGLYLLHSYLDKTPGNQNTPQSPVGGEHVWAVFYSFLAMLIPRQHVAGSGSGRLPHSLSLSWQSLVSHTAQRWPCFPDSAESSSLRPYVGLAWSASWIEGNGRAGRVGLGSETFTRSVRLPFHPWPPRWSIAAGSLAGPAPWVASASYWPHLLVPSHLSSEVLHLAFWSVPLSIFVSD